MKIFADPRNNKTNYSRYDKQTADFERFFGLPKNVHFCNSCVISNQRPNSAIEFKHRPDTDKNTIRFHDDGRCDACISIEAKHKINWALREKKLVELCDKHRRKDGHYDCLVPGSGGKDSFYQSHILIMNLYMKSSEIYRTLIFYLKIF